MQNEILARLLIYVTYACVLCTVACNKIPTDSVSFILSKDNLSRIYSQVLKFYSLLYFSTYTILSISTMQLIITLIFFSVLPTDCNEIIAQDIRLTKTFNYGYKKFVIACSFNCKYVLVFYEYFFFLSNIFNPFV